VKILSILLVLITLAIYWDVQTYEFINYDDNKFIVDNEHIKNGFSLDNLVYAFTDVNTGIWQPVTWLSHTLDCQLYKLNPMGHHWNNLIFHLANALLVFFILHRMTGALYRSFFVALLFAVHPIQVESVAWVAERKNVLSTFFYLLCILSYIRYTKDKKIGRYFIVILLYALGLMAKPMMVTMPFIFLLLDYWSLGRFKISPESSGSQSSGNIKNLIKEKIPFLIIAIIISVVSWMSQYIAGAMTDLDTIPLQARIELSLVSYIKYLYKLLWPTRLAFFYPYAGNIPLWKTLGSLFLIVLFSAYSIYCCNKKKHVLFGWFWFVIIIFPLIGLVNLGELDMADRYMYVPCIGIFIVIIWEAYNLTASIGRPKILFILFSSMLVIIFSLVSIVQVKTWRSNYSLYSHAIKVTNKNNIAHSNLGITLLNSGRVDEAIYHLGKALELKPQQKKSHFNLGCALAARKKFNEAKTHFYWFLNRFPDDMESIYLLGRVCFDLGEYEELRQYFLAYLKQNPNDVRALEYSGHISMKLKKYKDAKEYYLSAIKLRLDSPTVLNNLGVIYYNEGDLIKAEHFFKLSLKYNPDYREALLNLKNIQSQLKK
jgi:Flp pilus assembly protein TadD